MKNITRGRKSTGGEYLVTPPTFTESLLMEILIQIIDNRTTTSNLTDILTRAGFTEAEISERLQ